MRLRRSLPLLVVGALALGCMLLASCGDNKPPVTPDKGKDVTVVPDQPPVPDFPPKVDQPKWPDRPKLDSPRPREAYVGTPFGCQADSDCFGQRCCPTPWGVMLCSPSCDLK